MTPPVTLRELREFYPDLFYEQTWFEDEAFMDVALVPITQMPSSVLPCKAVRAEDADEMTDAVLLAALYVQHPTDPIWRNWIWTADCDQYGQRVYLGDPHGLGRLEIHRHLAIDHHWKVPIWT